MSTLKYDRLKTQIQTESEKIMFEKLIHDNVQWLGSNIADIMYNYETGDWDDTLNSNCVYVMPGINLCLDADECGIYCKIIV